MCCIQNITKPRKIENTRVCCIKPKNKQEIIEAAFDESETDDLIADMEKI